VSQYQKGKTNLDFTEARDSQETVSGSGISRAVCKSAPRSRQITTPVPHYSVFLQAGCPSCRPTNSVKALKVEQCNVTYRQYLGVGTHVVTTEYIWRLTRSFTSALVITPDTSVVHGHSQTLAASRRHRLTLVHLH